MYRENGETETTPPTLLHHPPTPVLRSGPCPDSGDPRTFFVGDTWFIGVSVPTFPGLSQSSSSLPSSPDCRRLVSPPW